jgi:hypothetical protein
LSLPKVKCLSFLPWLFTFTYSSTIPPSFFHVSEKIFVPYVRHFHGNTGDDIRNLSQEEARLEHSTLIIRNNHCKVAFSSEEDWNIRGKYGQRKAKWVVIFAGKLRPSDLANRYTHIFLIKESRLFAFCHF